MQSMFRILALDGGGLKGVFTASFLAEIERITGSRVTRYFDLVAGTSTGGIVALGLGLGLSPAEIRDFYLEYGPRIFPAQRALPRLARAARQVFHAKYSAEALESALRDRFGDHQLWESSVRLVIPAYDVVRGDVYIYKTPHHECLRTDFTEYAWRVARATAAAPTYFPAAINDGGVRLVDGGIWANNPSVVALAEALGYLRQEKESVFLLSIGTTWAALTSGHRHAFGGLWAWKRKALEFMLAGQVQSATNVCTHILGQDHVLRVDPVVPRGYGLDRLSRNLVALGVTEARKQVNTICRDFLQAETQPYEPKYRNADCLKGGISHA